MLKKKFTYKLRFKIEMKILKVETKSNNMTHPVG